MSYTHICPSATRIGSVFDVSAKYRPDRAAECFKVADQCGGTEDVTSVITLLRQAWEKPLA
jgi:hypothetical protein